MPVCLKIKLTELEEQELFKLTCSLKIFSRTRTKVKMLSLNTTKSNIKEIAD